MAQINLNPAHEVALTEFAAKNAADMAVNSMAAYQPERQRFALNFIGKEYFIEYPQGTVWMPETGDVPQIVQILLLHYLTHASPARVQGKNISFKELPSGMIYVGPFTNRAIRPLVGIFGQDPSKLIQAGKSLGGEVIKMGDAAVAVPVLPKIPVIFVVWEGDDEFPPTGNVLFDASAPLHLHTEDYAWLPGLALSEMKTKI